MPNESHAASADSSQLQSSGSPKFENSYNNGEFHKDKDDQNDVWVNVQLIYKRKRDVTLW